MPRIGPHIGGLRRRVTILKPVLSAGKQTWNDWVTVWAAFEQQIGIEAVISTSNPTNIATSLVRIRYLSGVKPKMRLRYFGRVLEIMSVIDPGEDHRELHLVVKEATV